MRGRIYVDFQNLDDENRVRLNTRGTTQDLAGRRLVVGERIALYSDDADDDGNPDPLIAEGVVEFGEDGSPAARVNWGDMRHASDESGTTTPPTTKASSCNSDSPVVPRRRWYQIQNWSELVAVWAILSGVLALLLARMVLLPDIAK